MQMMHLGDVLLHKAKVEAEFQKSSKGQITKEISVLCKKVDIKCSNLVDGELRFRYNYRMSIS